MTKQAGTELDLINRRDVLKLGVAGVVGSLVPLLSASNAWAWAYNEGSWRVDLHHRHTGERFNDVYRVGDRYLPDACQRLNHFLRDFRTREDYAMDPHVIDIISLVQAKAQIKAPLEVLSGYRSPKTNAMLRKVSSGVAKNSFHMYGQAIDICLPGFSTKKLCHIAKALKAGGVGYYPESGFVHVDTGRVRSW